jgi:Xaa-Pro aminopeptidase
MMKTLNPLLRQQCQLRRQQVLASMDHNSVAILPAASEVLRNRDTHFVFRQHSSFFYLTGLTEPDALLVLIKTVDSTRVIIFCAAQDATKARWEGPLLGPENAVGELAIDEAYALADVDQKLPELLENRATLYVDLGQQSGFDQRCLAWLHRVKLKVRSGVRAPETMRALHPLIDELRLIKTAFDVEQMQQSADIAVAAHQRAMRVCRAGMLEYQLDAELLHEFQMRGARVPAYPSIVGGGANACVLHYIDNDQVLKDGDLVLIDAGAEFNCYASDITRTFPVNGRFSDAQRALYDCVLQAQLAVIAMIKPGVIWDDLHQCALRHLIGGLLQLGLLQGDVETCLKDQSYKRFYMHNTGHWLGLDVHDVGAYKLPNAQGELQWRALQPGMVLTVEPGLYIAPEEDVDAQYRGIGIRIEDDVLVTQSGCQVLTAAAPKTIADIEALMASTRVSG